jgi:P-type conjugative transfer ATPase TrbB
MMKSELMKNHEYQILQSALGPEIVKYLFDPSVEEVMRNPDGNVWIDQKGIGEVLIGPIQNDSNAKRTIEIVASACGKICNREKPILAGEIPGLGYRFQGIMPDSAESPAWTIRIPSEKVYTLEDYVSAKIMTEEQKLVLTSAILEGRNTLVIGGTKSGKTTLVNGMLVVSSTTFQRHVLIEDTGELRCSAPNKVHLHSNKYASASDLLEATMRLSPKRIIIGEAKRGPEAYTFLMASNTGHKGIVCTIHANSAKDGLYRLEELLQENGMVPVPQAIARAIDIIVFIEATPTSRKVQEIVEVIGYSQDYELKPL